VPFPGIDPVAIAIGPFAIRWYALAFIVGLVGGWLYIGLFLRLPPHIMTRPQLSDFFTWAIVGVIAGGRIGYVSFYQAPYYFDNPLEILFVWQGGMSFHGGLLGVAVALWLFAVRRGVEKLRLADLVMPAIPIGLFFGRLANFINGELFGRVSDVPWAMVFPYGGPLARHPRQLYEAALEGLVLFAIRAWLALRTRSLERPGLLGGTYLAGYGIARIIVELFRQPDAHLGFLIGPATMGQLLSVPMLLVGLALVLWARRSGPAGP